MENTASLPPALERPSPRRTGQVLLGALALGIAAFVGARIAGVAGTVNRPAPDFHAELVLNGEPGQKELVLSQLQGRAVVLDFWASWCGPCRQEAPILERLYERYRDQGLTVVGVNTSDGEGAAAPAARRLKLAFPIVYDASESVARSYGVSGLPTLVVISKTGKIVAVRTGTTTEVTLEELVRKALEG